MKLTKTAETRLNKLLPREANGFSVEGFVGTCRGSTPVMTPVQQAEPHQEVFTVESLTFYLNRDISDRFQQCVLDYDRSFLGKGLTASWPQCDECACHS